MKSWRPRYVVNSYRLCLFCNGLFLYFCIFNFNYSICRLYARWPRHRYPSISCMCNSIIRFRYRPVHQRKFSCLNMSYKCGFSQSLKPFEITWLTSQVRIIKVIYNAWNVRKYATHEWVLPIRIRFFSHANLTFTSLFKLRYLIRIMENTFIYNFIF